MSCCSFGRAIKVAMTDWDNSDRREIGKGFVGTLFEREYREYLPSEIEEQIEEMDEHRSVVHGATIHAYHTCEIFQ